jgi:hypothetical protein
VLLSRPSLLALPLCTAPLFLGSERVELSCFQRSVRQYPCSLGRCQVTHVCGALVYSSQLRRPGVVFVIMDAENAHAMAAVAAAGSADLPSSPAAQPASALQQRGEPLLEATAVASQLSAVLQGRQTLRSAGSPP